MLDAGLLAHEPCEPDDRAQLAHLGDRARIANRVARCRPVLEVDRTTSTERLVGGLGEKRSHRRGHESELEERCVERVEGRSLAYIQTLAPQRGLCEPHVPRRE